jgi:predicted metalloenzyme YecM/phosphoglycolate phosphatase-like HAD superfamily hydrolase
VTIQLDHAMFGKDLPKAIANFVEPLEAELAKLGLDGAYSSIDHVCYRVADLGTYEFLKREVQSVASLLSEAFFNGRPIAAYRLHQKVNLSSGRTIDVLELPAPKPGVSYKNGFEHIEVVTNDSLESFKTAFDHHPFFLHNFAAKINRDISLKLPSGLVKFHENSLANIISGEQAQAQTRKGRRVAIFDFDDTLFASKPAFLRAFHKAYETVLGVSLSFSDLVEKQRPTFPEFFTSLGVSDFSVRKKILDKFVEQWDAVAASCILPVGVGSLISCLASEGVEIHVWTARDAVTTSSTLEAFGLKKYIKAIHGFDQNHASKPDSSGELREIVKGGRAVVVGDSVSDQNGALNLGATFIQAGWISKQDLTVPDENISLTPMHALDRIMKIL